MEIKIKEESYPIYLGFDAVNYLDQAYFLEVEGMKLGLGIASVIAQLKIGNVLATYNMIKAGTNTLTKKPSTEDIEEYIGSLTEKQFDKLNEDFISELKKQPLTRVTARKIVGAMENK